MCLVTLIQPIFYIALSSRPSHPSAAALPHSPQTLAACAAARAACIKINNWIKPYAWADRQRYLCCSRRDPVRHTSVDSNKEPPPPPARASSLWERITATRNAQRHVPFSANVHEKYTFRDSFREVLVFITSGKGRRRGARLLKERRGERFTHCSVCRQHQCSFTLYCWNTQITQVPRVRPS